MTYLELNESQSWSMINALHTAADSYKESARVRAAQDQGGLSEQFETQAKTALELATLVARS